MYSNKSISTLDEFIYNWTSVNKVDSLSKHFLLQIQLR